MSKGILAKVVASALVLAAAVGIGVAAYLIIGRRGPDPVANRRADAEGFRECAKEVGVDFRMAFLPAEQGEKFKINLYDHGCGVAVGDCDGDGRDDIYFVNQLGLNALYRNNGDGTFTDVTAKAGVGLGDRICVGAVWGDYDNDGRQDLYVTSTRGGNVLFRNMGDGTFKDVTKEAGLTEVAHSQTAVFFDYDGDGYPDLFVTNTAQWTLGDYDREAHYFPGPANFEKMAASPREHNVLYHNNHNGTFTDVTAKSGLQGPGWGGDVAVFDYDNDGRPDLFVTNMFGASQLYHNNGDGTFTDVTKEMLGRTSWGAIGSKAFDFNNDGRLDLLVVDMHSDMWLPAAIDPRTGTTDDLKKKYPKVNGPFYYREPGAPASEQQIVDAFKFRYEDVVFGNTLFKQLPSDTFKEVSDQANMETWWPWGIAVGDFDNDGYQDVFLPSGMGYPYGYWPNALMMNNGDETFTDRAAAAGIDPPPGGPYREEKIGGQPAAKSSRSAAVADFTGTGRLDLVVNNFNGPAYFYRNQFPKKNYISFRLTGTSYAQPGEGRKSSRDATGAMVRIFMGNEVMVRQVDAAGGYLSQSSKTAHFGLGDRPKVDRVEIRWPSGVVQTIEHPEINALHPVTEPNS